MDGRDRRQFFPQDLAGRENGTVLFLSGLVFVAPLCKLQNHTHGGIVRGAAANSSSALQLSLFLRFVQIEPYFVSKLSRILHTSRVSGIILNTLSVHADENSEMQTKSLAWGFYHCVKQRQCCCSKQACQRSLYSAALNLLLTDGAGKSPFP